MQEFTLRNATVFTGTDVLTHTSVRVSNGLIQEISSGELTGSEPIDLQEQWLVPGFVDLQVYGGSDFFLNELPTAETVAHIYQTHLKNGTTSVLPTLYSTSLEVMLKAIAAVRAVRQTNPNGVLGLHVEGPYVNAIKRGVHSLQYVRLPVDAELDILFEAGHDVIRILTIAPEIFSPEQLARLIDRTANTSTQLSLGHSNATYQEATAAFANGITLGTHLYNAMRPFESREPGVVGAIFDHPAVRASIVVDGFHCDWAAIRLAKRVLGERLFLISDAIFANPPQPTYAFEDFTLQYENGRYTNHEGKLAGSSITLLNAVQNSIHHVGLDAAEAFRMASTVPAEIIGLGDSLGKIQPGFVANLVVLNQDLAVSRVLVSGQFQPSVST
ncbi:N-acetylglucosamine-6-phosphate deacetylase [Larkinella terrae]|uniref:N-acetylglucosamine-6-phosphate deacetylase n=1 Tax=Larkinella terrae TaxID=2025311 RepID=A0A7K0EFC3_9BACT|nr:N-acetylglucosamine-6-phosphate deacetylase [Larkinella terrae]MRS60156.1 N-acetylglucosamine-6-phosphate deacetylase [Larkinella terrae]